MLKIKQFLIVLTIILLVNPISFAQIILAEGTLADESFIEIENSDELAEIEDDLEKNYVLTDDIDLKDAEWESIDKGEFTGTLTGDDYKIKSMPTQYLEDENYGLFTRVEDLDNIDLEIEFAAKEIENSDELANIKEDLTGDYILSKDIDLKDAEWEPIQGEFTGTLTGGDFKIKNMPAEYLEDANFGLFTEVADKKNIDVEVEFAEVEANEETDEPQGEEEAAEEEAEEPQGEEKTIEEETEEPQNEEESVEEETEEPQSEEQIVKEDSEYEKKKLTQNRAILPNEVSTHGELRTALEDSTITEINLMKDISTIGDISNRIDIAPREVVINGNGNELKQTGRGGTGTQSYSMMRPLLSGKESKITFKDIDLVSSSGNSIITEKGDAVDWTVIFENVNINKEEGVTPSTGRLVNAENAHVKFKEEVNFVTTGSTKPIIDQAKSVTVESEASASFLTADYFYTTSNPDAELNVASNALLDIEAQMQDKEKTLIEMSGDNSAINITGGTFNLDSNRSTTGKKDGLIKLTGEDSQFNVNNGKIDFKHEVGSILYMSSKNGKVNVSGEEAFAKFFVKSGNNNNNGVIHLHETGGYELNVNNKAELEVIKESGKAMGIEIGEGAGNKVTVSSGAKFSIRNEETGLGTNPDGSNASYQALHFFGKLAEFNLSGVDSEVSLIADKGVAMHMAKGGKINVGEGTTFIAHGKTASAANGIIDTGGSDDKGSEIIMEKPKYYDFRNNNNQGLVFHVGKNSSMKGKDTEIAAWKKGTDLDGSSTWSLPSINYKFDKLDLVNFVNGPPELEALTEEYPNGLKAYARLSGDNSGELAFVSAPKNLNFTVKVKSYKDEYLVNLGEIGEDLVVSDDRPNKDRWELAAKMDEQLTAETGEELTNALFYRGDGKNVNLTNVDAVVKSHEYGEDATKEEEIFNLSEDWGPDDNGMFIEIEPGTKKTEYNGTVKWTLYDAP